MPQHSTQPQAAARTAARLLLAAILLAAASLKAFQLSTDRVFSTGLLNSRMVQAGSVAIEFVLGLWLLSGWNARRAGWIASFGFLIFALVAGWKVAGGEPSCGCFGKLQVRPWQSLLLDLAAIPAAVFIGLDSRKPAPWRTARIAAALVLALAAGGFIKLALFPPSGRPDVKAIVLEPDRWKGAPWLLGEYIDIWPALSRGNWAVLMYSPDCEDCQPTVRAYAALAGQWKSRGGPARIAMIATTEGAPADDFPDLTQSAATLGRLETPPDLHWFIPPPTLVILRDGHVLEAVDGEGHCDWDDARFGKW